MRRPHPSLLTIVMLAGLSPMPAMAMMFDISPSTGVDLKPFAMRTCAEASLAARLKSFNDQRADGVLQLQAAEVRFATADELRRLRLRISAVDRHITDLDAEIAACSAKGK